MRAAYVREVGAIGKGNVDTFSISCPEIGLVVSGKEKLLRALRAKWQIPSPCLVASKHGFALEICSMNRVAMGPRRP